MKRKGVVPEWGELRDAPRLDVPDPHRLVRRRRLITLLIGAVIVAFPITALTAAGLYAQIINEQNRVIPGAGFSLARMVALADMERWLAQDPSPLPGGRVLTVDAVDELPSFAQAGQEPKWSAQLVSFTLVDGAGRMFRSQVQVAVDPRGSAQVVGSPSLEAVPVQASDQWVSGSPWPGAATVTVSEAAKLAVQRWAEVYVAGDPDALRQFVGDDDPDHWFEPLAGVQKVTATAAAATPIDAEQVLAVRVELAVLWQGQPEPTTTTHLPVITMDVRLEKADGAAPVVTAWGAPGVGPALERFGNAVEGGGRRPAPVPTFAATPTPTPSGAAAPPVSPPADAPVGDGTADVSGGIEEGGDGEA